MKKLIKISLFLLIPVLLTAAAYRPAVEYWKMRNRPNWRTAKIDRGDIISYVNSTGTVKPKLQVSVGAFVSGPIVDLPVEFNQEVKKGQLLAQIDERLYQANLDRDQATLENRKADVIRVKAQLQQAINDEKRSLALREEDKTFISQAEIDKYKFSRMSLEAQLDVAVSSVAQAEATLKNSQANLDYTKIKSPVDGIIINRKIDPGQTLAAQFQTPELFIVAPDMRTEMHVHANVDEVEIGRVQEAQRRKSTVTFTVDSYQDQIFEGEILEVRLSSTTTQNVVTYPVIVKAPNPDLKLLPGMTASLSFKVDERKNVIRIPNAALRFYPTNIFHVREEDRKILDGSLAEDGDSEQDGFDDPDDPFTNDEQATNTLSVIQKSEIKQKRKYRYVWVNDGEFLRGIKILTGLDDGIYTELLEGDLKEGDQLVTGIRLPPTYSR